MIYIISKQQRKRNKQLGKNNGISAKNKQVRIRIKRIKKRNPQAEGIYKAGNKKKMKVDNIRSLCFFKNPEKQKAGGNYIKNLNKKCRNHKVRVVISQKASAHSVVRYRRNIKIITKYF